MGVPKFYRWISERYPCLSEKIREYQIPDFDNLYLDMNGIIHSCSHPNDDDVHLRIPEEVIFREIFRYIDYLFRMIKPGKVFFMAIDGVAPRAKMNQQRGRRFRSAKLALDQEAEAVKKGEKLPSDDRFDSNCITPGTEFMAKLHDQLQYFVKVKVSTDPLWQRQGLCIYLSGHDVPGEGEHKIMDFIRHIRSQPDYDADTRHCLYGLDADLIMLGLSSHELHFSLLREEVKFGTQKKRPRKRPEQVLQQANSGDSKFDLSTVSIFKVPEANDAIPSSNNNNNNSKIASNSSTSTNNTTNNNKNESQIDLLQFFVKSPLATASTTDASTTATTTATLSYSGALKTEVVPEASKTNNVSNNNATKNNGVVDSVLELSNLEKELIPLPSAKELKNKETYHPPLPEKTNFLLLHLSLLRDYIDAEFQDLKKALEGHPFIKYDLENVIDDWILMSILVGNDFVPNLPNLHINSGALPLLYKTYTSVLPKLQGYINEHGTLKLDRFEVYIKELSEFDIEHFRGTYDDMKYMASKTGKNIVLGEKMFVTPFTFDDDDGFEDEEELEVNSELQALINRTNEAVELKPEDSSDNDDLPSADIFPVYDDLFDEEDSPEFRLEFSQFKRNYYKTKIETSRPIREEVKAMVVEYIQAIQWVLLYYYKGVSSWCWYYPYHYSPFTSDLRNFKDFEIIFDKGQPFKPFEQLLAVLPSYSKKLLPLCYQGLMINEDSPIKAYYPEKFEQDLNGKKQDWEAVVVIPFIDEKKLIEAMEQQERLNSKEVFRNSRGKMLLHRYTKSDTGPVESPGNIFPRLSTTHVEVEGIEDVAYDPKLLPKGVHPKAQRDKIYQGFPTIKSINHLCSLENAKVKVFDFLARDVSMVLDLSVLDEEEEKLRCETVAKDLLGKTIWVNWPHLTHVLVTGVSDSSTKFVLTEQGGIRKDPTYDKHEAVTKGLIERHLKYKGIKLGAVEIIIWAKLMEGRKVRVDKYGKMQIENLWGKIEQPFARKTSILHDKYVTVFSMTDCESETFTDVFKEGDTVFILEKGLYGAMAKVLKHALNKIKVIVDYRVPVFRRIDEESYDDVQEKLYVWGEENYFSSIDISRMCNLPTSVLAKLTGSIFVEAEKGQGQSPKKKKRGAGKQKNNKNGKDEKLEESPSSPEEEIEIAQETKRVNVGLDLKFNKRNLKVRGYTSKDGNGKWIYSLKTANLVKDYMKQFPEMVNFLKIVSGKDRNEYKASEIYKNDPRGKIREIEIWLENRGLRDAQRIDINANIMDEDEIQIVWKHVLATKVNAEKDIIKSKSIRPNLLFKPGLDRGNVLPGNDSNVVYELLDRVVCVDQSSTMPLGQRGTVVGIQQPQVQEESATIEESFKATNATLLETLIILCDPQPDVFEAPSDEPSSSSASNSNEIVPSKSKEDMTSSLSSLLGINYGTSDLSLFGAVGDSSKGELTKSNDSTKSQVKKEEYKPLPRLVKLFPFQVLKISGCEVQMFRDERSQSKVKQNLPSKTIVINNSNIKKQGQYPSNISLQEQAKNRNTVGNIPSLFPSQVLLRQQKQQQQQSSPAANNVKNLPFKPIPFVKGSSPLTSTLNGTHPKYGNAKPLSDIENYVESAPSTSSNTNNSSVQVGGNSTSNNNTHNSGNRKDRENDRKGNKSKPIQDESPRPTITILKRPQQQQQQQQQPPQQKQQQQQKQPSEQKQHQQQGQASNKQQKHFNPINALLEESLAKQKKSNPSQNNNNNKSKQNQTFKNKDTGHQKQENKQGSGHAEGGNQQNRDKDKRHQNPQPNIPHQNQQKPQIPQSQDPIQQLVMQLQSQSQQQQRQQQQPGLQQHHHHQQHTIAQRQGASNNKSQQQEHHHQRKREQQILSQQQAAEINRLQMLAIQNVERMRPSRGPQHNVPHSQQPFVHPIYHPNLHQHPHSQPQHQHQPQQHVASTAKPGRLFVPTQVSRSAFASTGGSSSKINPSSSVAAVPTPLNKNPVSVPASQLNDQSHVQHVQHVNALQKPPEYSPYYRMSNMDAAFPNKPAISSESPFNMNNTTPKPLEQQIKIAAQPPVNNDGTDPSNPLQLNFRGLSISSYPTSAQNIAPETGKKEGNQNSIQDKPQPSRRLAANFNF